MKYLKLLSELVRIESVDRNGSNEAIDFCEKWLLENGLESKILVNNGYKSLVCEIGEGIKTLIFNGHLDVVSAKEGQFIPIEDGGRLYGRGTADMKAGCAAMMAAFTELKDSELPCKIQLQLVTDEEIGGLNCSMYLVEEGFKGDFVICGEPTNLGLGIQAKGILQLDIEVFGKSAHGSRPWEGDNAILRAMGLFNQITELPFAKESSELYDFPSINLSKIEGGEVYNKVPDYCKMSLDIRFLPEQNIDEIMNQIMGLGIENIRIHAAGDPVKTKVNNKHVLELAQIVEKKLNNPPRIFGQHGSADTRFFSKYSIPAIEFGPCGGNWHGDEEYVDIESFYNYIEILKKFALDFK